METKHAMSKTKREGVRKAKQQDSKIAKLATVEMEHAVQGKGRREQKNQAKDTVRRSKRKAWTMRVPARNLSGGPSQAKNLDGRDAIRIQDRFHSSNAATVSASFAE